MNSAHRRNVSITGERVPCAIQQRIILMEERPSLRGLKAMLLVFKSLCIEEGQNKTMVDFINVSNEVLPLQLNKHLRINLIRSCH